MTLRYQGEVYLTGREAAKFFQVSHTTFYERYAPSLAKHEIPGYDREYYKKSELENYQGPQVVRSEQDTKES